MPGLKPKDIREMSREDQQKELDGAHQELFNLRFQLATRQLQNYCRINEVRRNIARLMGIMNEQEAEA
ncbi:MAG TPA: 50S ribosomal protein L29 [Chloroflexota bacterium]|nr:50S ribosomal protein L29 [Chloroflexota bacterium]